MTGNRINIQQKRLYMKKRYEGATQETAAAKAGISLRGAQRLESNKNTQSIPREKIPAYPVVT